MSRLNRRHFDFSWPSNSHLPRFRCEIQGAGDPRLIARFFRAENAQAALELCKRWLRIASLEDVKISVLKD